MIGQFIITYTGMPLQPKGIARKKMNDILRGAWFLVGVHWHKKMRPKHFTEAGAREYRYQRRSKAYLKRKLNPKTGPGHTRPLEFSRQSRKLTKIRDVRPTAKGVRIVMGANKFNFRASINAPNMRDEMTTVSASEQREIERLLGRLIERGIAQDRTRTTVRV